MADVHVLTLLLLAASPASGQEDYTSLFWTERSWTHGEKKIAVWVTNASYPFSTAQLASALENTSAFFARNSFGNTTLNFVVSEVSLPGSVDPCSSAQMQSAVASLPALLRGGPWDREVTLPCFGGSAVDRWSLRDPNTSHPIRSEDGPEHHLSCTT